MDAAEFVMGEAKRHFVTRIETCKDRMGAFDNHFYPFLVLGRVSKCDGVTSSGDIGKIGWLVWFRLNPNFQLRIVSEHLVDHGEQTFVSELGILGLANVGTLPSQPKHDGLGADGPSNVHAALSPLPSVVAILFTISGVASVDGLFGKPKSWRDKLR